MLWDFKSGTARYGAVRRGAKWGARRTTVTVEYYNFLLLSRASAGGHQRVLPLRSGAMFKTVAIIGSGALGSYYGGRLAQHGHDVHFLLRSDYEHVKRHGLRVFSYDGDFSLSPGSMRVYDDVRTMPKVDLVVVTLKTTANDLYELLVGPLLHEKSTILTLQNGLGNEERLAELFGASRVLGGLAFICTNRAEPGVIRHTDHGFIKLGEYQGGPSARASAVCEMFRKSKVPCDVLNDLRYGRWEKLVWNVPFNGLGAALDAETDRLLANETGRELVRKLMEEVIATAARAADVHLPVGTAQRQIDRTTTMGAYVSSMQVDRRAGRAMEIESIVGEVLRRARSCEVPVPILQVLYEQLIAINLGNGK
jgi:2-dehydropantoate 2-reductase